MTTEYHKIQTVYKRDPATKHKTLLEGEFSLPEFEYLRDNNWTFTEKVDGTNIRLMSTPDGVRIGGRTDNAQIPAFLLEDMEPIVENLKASHTDVFGDADVVLYGEGYGAKIQKGGGNYRSDHSFVLFDVKVGNWWLQRRDVEDIATKLSIEVVPIIGEGSIDWMVELARDGLKSEWGDFEAEGLVARPATELRTRSGHRIITKIKWLQ